MKTHRYSIWPAVSFLLLPTLFLFGTFDPVQGQIITTIAGDGVAGYNGDGIASNSSELYYPVVVAVDPTGNVYIADEENHRVRKVDVSTGLISTFAGTGVSGFSGDSGPAASAQISFPEGLCFDQSGNLYIADFSNFCVRKVTPGGIISTVAGSGGVVGYSGDGGPAISALLGVVSGVAVDSANNLYICDNTHNIIRRVDGTSGLISTYAGTPSINGYTGNGGPATSATFSYNLDGVAVDAQGNVYAVDAGNNVIRKITAATGIITTWAGTGSYGFSGDGGPATSAQFAYVGSISFDGAGNAYLTDETPNARVRRVNPSGIIDTVVGNGTSGFCGDGGPPLSACLYHPEDTVADTLGNLYIADYVNQRVRKVTELTMLYTPTPTESPTPTLSPTPSPTFTWTPTATSSFTPTPTPPFTPTSTPTSTASFTPTFTPTCVPQAWPDPFNPKYAKDGKLKIGCVPPGASVSIYTLSGEAVWGASQSSYQYGSPDTATWNGTNQNGVTVAPGVYYYAILEGNQALQRGKFLVVNGP